MSLCQVKHYFNKIKAYSNIDVQNTAYFRLFSLTKKTPRKKIKRIKILVNRIYTSIRETYIKCTYEAMTAQFVALASIYRRFAKPILEYVRSEYIALWKLRITHMYVQKCITKHAGWKRFNFGKDATKWQRNVNHKRFSCTFRLRISVLRIIFVRTRAAQMKWHEVIKYINKRAQPTHTQGAIQNVE